MPESILREAEDRMKSLSKRSHQTLRGFGLVVRIRPF